MTAPLSILHRLTVFALLLIVASAFGMPSVGAGDMARGGTPTAEVESVEETSETEPMDLIEDRTDTSGESDQAVMDRPWRLGDDRVLRVGTAADADLRERSIAIATPPPQIL